MLELNSTQKSDTQVYVESDPKKNYIFSDRQGYSTKYLAKEKFESTFFFGSDFNNLCPRAGKTFGFSRSIPPIFGADIYQIQKLESIQKKIIPYV